MVGPAKTPHQIEILPVPREMVARVWRQWHLVLRWYNKYPGDIRQLKSRALLGHSTLWFIADRGVLRDALITSISRNPPAERFRFHDPAANVSLMVHLASGSCIQAWIEQVVGTLTRYGREHNCRQVFVLARQNWRKYAVRFFFAPGGWDRVSVGKDRQYYKEGKAIRRLSNRPGHYREVTFAPPGLHVANYGRSAKYCYLRPADLKRGASHGFSTDRPAAAAD